MICGKCGINDAKCIDSRMRKGIARRRRYECKRCQHRWTTYEVIARDEETADFMINKGSVAKVTKEALRMLDEMKSLIQTLRLDEKKPDKKPERSEAKKPIADMSQIKSMAETLYAAEKK